jgi:hypothetical protein
LCSCEALLLLFMKLQQYSPRGTQLCSSSSSSSNSRAVWPAVCSVQQVKDARIHPGQYGTCKCCLLRV